MGSIEGIFRIEVVRFCTPGMDSCTFELFNDGLKGYMCVPCMLPITDIQRVVVWWFPEGKVGCSFPGRPDTAVVALIVLSVPFISLWSLCVVTTGFLGVCPMMC